MSRWGESEPVPPADVSAPRMAWRVILTWRERDPDHGDTIDIVRVRDFETHHEASERYTTVQRMILEEAWRPTPRAFDIEIASPHPLGGLNAEDPEREPVRPSAAERWEARTQMGAIRTHLHRAAAANQEVGS